MSKVYLSDVLKDNYIPRQAALHDCANTVGSQTLVSGIRTLYTNDKVAYEYQSSISLWDSINSKAHDSILASKLDIVLGGIYNSATANNRMLVEVEIDAPTPIMVKTKTIPITRNNIDIADFLNFSVYNGADALLYGFKIYLTAEVANIVIKNKTILIRA